MALLLLGNEADCLIPQRRKQNRCLSLPPAPDRSANYRASGLVLGRLPGIHLEYLNGRLTSGSRPPRRGRLGGGCGSGTEIRRIRQQTVNLTLWLTILTRGFLMEIVG